MNHAELEDAARYQTAMDMRYDWMRRLARVLNVAPFDGITRISPISRNSTICRRRALWMPQHGLNSQHHIRFWRFC